jgi:hypothetical protein
MLDPNRYYSKYLYNIVDTRSSCSRKKEFKVMFYIKKIFAKLSESFVTLYCVLGEFVETIAENLFKIQKFQYNSGRQFLLFANKEKYWKYYAIFLLSFNFFPRFLLLFCLMVDVFLYHRLHYTFMCIPFLLLPLISMFIVFCLKQHHEEFSRIFIPW